MTKRRHVTKWRRIQLAHESEFSMDNFKPLPGTGGLVIISRDGKVLSRQRELPEGYWIVRETGCRTAARRYNRFLIQLDGKKKNVQLSRAILLAWVGEPDGENDQAIHKNGNSLDDRLDNLKWGTALEAKDLAIDRGTWAHGEKIARLFEADQVKAIRVAFEKYKCPQNLIARIAGIPQARIADITSRRTWNDGELRTSVDPSRNTNPIRAKENAHEPRDHQSSRRRECVADAARPGVTDLPAGED